MQCLKPAFKALLSKVSVNLDRLRVFFFFSGEAAFHLSSILIYAAMTMRVRLGGALAGSCAHVKRHCVCRCALRSRGLDFPQHPHTAQIQWISRYISSPLPPENPVSTDMLSVGWNNIFLCVCSLKRHSITSWCRQLLKEEKLHILRRSSRAILAVYITLLDRIQPLILLSSSCIILIALWAPLLQLSLLGAVTAHINADYTTILLADDMIYN